MRCQSVPSGVTSLPDTPHFHFSALQEEGAIRLAKADESKKAREGHGLYRTLCNNMMVGVSTGFEKKLKLVGVGYKAAMQGKDLNLALGYAHPVILEVPEGLKVECLATRRSS